MVLPKFARLLIPVLALTIVRTSMAQANVRTQIQANYDKISRLSMMKDMIQLAKVTRTNAASNFEYLDALQNSFDLDATVRQNAAQLERVSAFNFNSNTIIALKRLGRDLVCTLKTDYDLFLDPAKTRRVKGTCISEDTWIKTMKGWKIKRSKVVKETESQNGKILK